MIMEFNDFYLILVRIFFDFNLLIIVIYVLVALYDLLSKKRNSRLSLAHVVINGLIIIPLFFKQETNVTISIALMIEAGVTIFNLIFIFDSFGKSPRLSQRNNMNVRMPQYQPYFQEELLNKADKYSGIEFERYCASLLKMNGFHNVTMTPESGDQGADIIAFRGSIKYVIQCKRYSSPLGNTPIQEVFAAKTYYKADKAAVMTNSAFTQGAKNIAKSTGTLLWDREVLKKFLSGDFHG